MTKRSLLLLQDAAIRARVRKAIRAVATRLAVPLPPAEVHQLRRALKQLRAWCRLLHASGQPGARRLQRGLRELAAHYGTARDAQVQLETLESLEKTARHRFAHSRKVLAAGVPALAAPPSATTCARHLATLQLLDERLHSALPAADALRRGLVHSRRKAARCCRKAWHTLDPDLLHELRKRVKMLCNQYLLCVDRRGAAGREQQLLDRLGKNLGRHHDLVVLRAALVLQGDDKVPGAELAELGTLIAAEELELYPPGMALSEKCFPGKVR